MKATNWEFSNRALIFGLLFGLTFPLYFFDHQNSSAALANWLGPRVGMDADLLARLLFALAAIVLIAAALIRTWASAYLNAGVVYASAVKNGVSGGRWALSARSQSPVFRQCTNGYRHGRHDETDRVLVAVVAMLVFC